jgi:hypothetical protein
MNYGNNKLIFSGANMYCTIVYNNRIRAYENEITLKDISGMSNRNHWMVYKVGCRLDVY